MKCSHPLIRSVVKGVKSNISNGDNGTEPARELLERLFAKTKSLDPSASQDRELSMSIEVLKTEFEAALSILRKKERDLRDAEKKVSVDRSRLNQTKQDLDQREEDIIKAYSRQHEMEKALMRASRDLSLQVRQINNLKLLVEEQDKKIVSSQAALSKKVIEVDKLKQDMLKKNEKADLINTKEDQLVQVRSELQDKEQRIQLMQDELDKMRLGRSQAESVVQKIVELTGNLIGSVEGEEFDIYNLLDDEILSTGTALESNLHKHSQLEADIDMLKESLEQKDVDLRAAYKALDTKDLELKAVLRRLDVRDKELDKLEELSMDPYDVRRLSSLADEATKDNNVEEVELRKHEIESVEGEALAASTMLKKLADITKAFLRSGRTDSGTNLLAPQNANISAGASKMEPNKKMNVILEAKREIVGLFSLTEELVASAGINDAEKP